MTNSFRTFPNSFTAGAKIYAGISDQTGFHHYFPTVLSLSQHSALPHAAPSQDPHGYFFRLLPTPTPLNSISYFRSAYPGIAALRTCHAYAEPAPAFNPPGLVVITHLAQPTLFTPAEPDRGSRSIPSTTGSDTDTGTFSTMLDSISVSTAVTERSTVITTDKQITTHSFAAMTSSSKGPRRPSVNPLQTSESLSTSSISTSKGVSSSGTEQISPPQNPSLSTSAAPLRNIPSLTASNSADEEATKTSTASKELESVSVVHGNVIVDGHTLDTGTTLTLGSRSVLTAVALTTNQIGQTVLLGNITAAKSYSSERPSHSRSILPIVPSNMPSPTDLPAPASTNSPTPGSANRMDLTRIFRLWAVFWTLRAIAVRGCTGT